MEKPHKKHTPKADVKLLEEVRTYLRANAPQVKFVSIDNLFTGSITTTERKYPKGEPHKQFELKFKDFDELKKHYGKISSKNGRRDASGSDKSRNKSEGSGRGVKGSVEKQQSKGRNSRPDNVQSRKSGRKV